ncbi:MAG: PrgI family protein [bacterium]|nr:PrgI family protein [bacterium]
MQFQVPQFIETENKIVGPLTLRQFLYLAGAGGVSFSFFFLIETWLWLVTTALLGAIGVSLAFVTINGRPLPAILRAALSFYWKPHFFLWQREKGVAREELPALEFKKKRRVPLAERLAVGDKLKELFEKLQTSRSPIPKRESASHRPWRWPAKGGVPQVIRLRESQTRGDAVSPAGGGDWIPPKAVTKGGDARATASLKVRRPAKQLPPQKSERERFEVLRKITGAPQVAKRVDYR